MLSDEACINTHLDKPGVLFNSISVPNKAQGFSQNETKNLAHEYADFEILFNNTPDVQSYQLALSNT